MHMFDPSNKLKSPAHTRLYAAFEVMFTAVNFAAALLFVAGSIMFFWESTKFPATWCFLIGSVCFALTPTLRVVREFRYVKLDKIAALANRERQDEPNPTGG